MLTFDCFYLICILCFIALGSAFIAEFYFDLAPCEMCLKQREPYYVIIISFVFIALLRWQKGIWFYLIVQIMSIYGLFYSIWHVGIENQLLLGPAGCSSGLNLTDNTLSLKEQNIIPLLYRRVIELLTANNQSSILQESLKT